MSRFRYTPSSTWTASVGARRARLLPRTTASLWTRLSHSIPPHPTILPPVPPVTPTLLVFVVAVFRPVCLSSEMVFLMRRISLTSFACHTSHRLVPGLVRSRPWHGGGIAASLDRLDDVQPWCGCPPGLAASQRRIDCKEDGGRGNRGCCFFRRQKGALEYGIG